MSHWKTYKHNELTQVPDSPGVYAIYCKDKLCYIGEDARLRKRLTSYSFTVSTLIAKNGGTLKDCTFKVLPCMRLGEWHMRSLRLRVRLTPSWNHKAAMTKEVKYLRTLYRTRSVARMHLYSYGEAVLLVRRLKEEGRTNNYIATYLNSHGYQSDTLCWTPAAVIAVKRCC